jgi:hypothetical protein
MSRLASGRARRIVSISALGANWEVNVRSDSVAMAPCAAISATETAADAACGAAWGCAGAAGAEAFAFAAPPEAEDVHSTRPTSTT